MPRAASRSTPKANAKPRAPGVGKKSKTGDPACSEAMSMWVRARHAGIAVASSVFATLGKCRSLARQRKMAEGHENAGNDLKAQTIRHRLREGVAGNITQAERKAAAQAKRGELEARRAARAKSKESPKFALKQENNRGPGKFENAGPGRTPFMFDMKRGDKPGQMSIMDKVGTIDTKASNRQARATAAIMAKSKAAAAKGAAIKAKAGKLPYERMADEMERMSGNTRVRIADLRAKFPGMSKEEFDRNLDRVEATGRASMYKLDNPLEVTDRDHANAFKTRLGEERHIFYAGGRTSDRASVKTRRRVHAEALAEERAKAPAPAAKAKARGGRQVAHLAGAPATAAATSLKPMKANPREVLARGRKATAERVRSLRAGELEQKAPERFGKVGKTYDFKTDKIQFDPDRFQYKLAAQGSHGTTEALKDVRKWDAELAGTISVWKDPANGKTYVVNGHHRLDLAKRMGVKNISARYIEAKDAREARAKGALVNIAEGRGSAIDSAKFFRDSGVTREGLQAKGVSLREQTASQGLAMAGLSERTFNRVVNGEISQNRAAIIGGSGLSHAQQDQLVKVLDKPSNRKLTDGTVRNMTEAAKAAGSRTKTVQSLFGADEHEESLFIHRAKLEDKISRDLSADKRLFGLVSKSKAAAKLAERGRSTIDTGETGKVSAESAAVMDVFKQLKNRHPRVSRVLQEGTERIANGENERIVANETRKKLTSVIKGILEGDDAF